MYLSQQLIFRPTGKQLRPASSLRAPQLNVRTCTQSMDAPLLENDGGDAGGGGAEDKSGLPSWLDPENDEDHQSLVSSDHEVSGARASSSSWADDPPPGAGGGGGRRQQQSDLPKLVLGVRIVNIGAAVALITCSCFAMQGTLSPSQWILAGYGASSGILLLCLETQLTFLKDRIADSFGFLFNPVLRFLFLLLTASVSWLHHHIFSDAVAIALIVVAVLNLYVMCRFPTLWEIQKTNR
mmetsp:Transcript_16048/g.35721  ORF Transcript_16048/g.35721 Transcript_16048/m.35721 type:complete len:239 (+) Transcript_16048:68-784(+)